MHGDIRQRNWGPASSVPFLQLAYNLIMQFDGQGNPIIPYVWEKSVNSGGYYSRNPKRL